MQVKADMRNEQVIVRKTVQYLDRKARTSTVKVFALTEFGQWVLWPEGKKYPDGCELPIYSYREFFDEKVLPAAPASWANRLQWSLDGDMICVKPLDFTDLQVSPCVFISQSTPLGTMIIEDGLDFVPENILEKIVSLINARRDVGQAESDLARDEAEQYATAHYAEHREGERGSD